MGDLNRDGGERYPKDEDARRQQQMREMHMLQDQAKMAIQGGSMGGASRASAQQLLQQRIYEAEQRASHLRALSAALPLELPPLADEALWQMLVAMR